MKGSNKLSFNQSTMVEAMQKYLDGIMKVSPTVTKVEYMTGSQYSSGGVTGNFEISVDGTTDE